VLKLPQKVICSKCGYVLYKGMELKSPDEIIQKYEKCPSCGRKLSIKPIKIEIEPYQQTKEK